MDCKGITVDFYNQSIDGLDFVWYFGNGQTSTDVNPSMQYAYSINPVITLVAVNNICRDSLVVQRNLPPLSEFLKNAMPNVFTPNQDGKNDCFAPGKIGDFEDCVSFSVFNRWGNLIYEVGPRGCWNGKHKDNGLDVPAGVYFYSMKVAGVDVKGSLNLIR
jgi:gliding motility-associated-like protein